MKPAPFAYRVPQDLGEVTDLLAEHGPGAVLIAGGQSLVPLMALRRVRPRMLVDLNRVEGLAGVRAERDSIVVGATTRQRTVERSPLIAERLPLLSRAVAEIGHPQVRSRGTVGGSLAVGDPCSELPAAALALDAAIVLVARGSRRVLPASGFYGREGAGALRPEETVTEIRFQVPPPGAGYGFRETSRRVRDLPTAGAAVVLAVDGAGVCTYARVALMGAGPAPCRAPAVENALVGERLSGPAIEAAAALAGDESADDDVRDMSAALTARALTDAAGRIGEGGAR